MAFDLAHFFRTTPSETLRLPARQLLAWEVQAQRIAEEMTNGPGL